MSKTIYFDQKGWIELFKENEGKTNNQEIRKSLEMLTKAIEESRVIVPLSFSNLHETCKISDNVKREKLMDFILDISKGYAIIPYWIATTKEIIQMVLNKVGFQIKNFRDEFIGIGISYVIGCDLELKPMKPDDKDLPESVKKELLDKADSPDIIRCSMKELSVVEYFHEITNRRSAEMENLEKCRVKFLDLYKDKKIRRKVAMVYCFRDIINPTMTRITSELRLNPKRIMREGITEDELEQMLRDIPTAYTSYQLTFNRDVQGHRLIAANDLNDIAQLSIAIPYCDIVVTENMWVHIAKKENLDKLYNTTLLTSVAGLHKYL